jgi:glycine amidinotransferase
MTHRRVCSYNEWDPLEEVIVGSVRGAHKMSYEPALAPYYLPHERGVVEEQWSDAEVAEAEAQLDGLAEMLQRLGIVVQRPDPHPADGHVKTPDFEVFYGNSYACPRDVLLVIGDQIIEAPMSHRGRFFEYRGYRRILREYFASGAQWVAAPKTLMCEETYRRDFATQRAPFDPREHHILDTLDPCFDAACFARLGRDIFWQPDLVSNDQGFEWLRRQLGPAYRLHRVESGDRCPQHIDTTLVPLRPGIVLANPERPIKGDGLDIFLRNGWRVLYPPPSVRVGLPAPCREVSNWISMNVLVLDQHTVIVEQAEDPFADFLQQLDFRVLRCPFDKVYKFGGGFHCCTVDVRRAGELESYFPSED